MKLIRRKILFISQLKLFCGTYAAVKCGQENIYENFVPIYGVVLHFRVMDFVKEEKTIWPPEKRIRIIDGKQSWR